MIYDWKVKSYAYLVKIGRYDLYPTEGSNRPVVEESYREPVAVYLAKEAKELELSE